MKTISKQGYIKKFRNAIEKRHGTYDEVLHGLIVSKAASDFHLLDLYDEQLENADFVQLVAGSTGQIKQEINPLLAARDKASRTCQAALESLMLTPQSTYKKVEGSTQDSGDKMVDYFNSLNN